MKQLVVRNKKEVLSSKWYNFSRTFMMKIHQHLHRERNNLGYHSLSSFCSSYRTTSSHMLCVFFGLAHLYQINIHSFLLIISILLVEYTTVFLTIYLLVDIWIVSNLELFPIKLLRDLCTNICLLIFGEGNGTPLQYSCLENPMDGGAWQAAVRGVAKSRTRLSDFTFTFHFHTLEKEMATHSSVLAWRIPGTGEPDGLPSMGSHRVGHD